MLAIILRNPKCMTFHVSKRIDSTCRLFLMRMRVCGHLCDCGAVCEYESLCNYLRVYMYTCV